MDQDLGHDPPWWRRPRVVALSTGGLVLVVVAASFAWSSGNDQQARVTADQSLTSTSTSSSTTSAPSTTTIEVPTTISPTTTTARAAAPPSTTSTTLYCRNSTNPACGPMYYDPREPPNTPTVIVFTRSTDLPRVGEELTITVKVRDPDDATVVGNCSTMDPDLGYQGPEANRGKVTSGGWCVRPNYIETERYGPWDPPNGLGYKEIPYTLVYGQAGSHTVRFSERDPGRCGGMPACPNAVADYTFTVLP